MVQLASTLVSCTRACARMVSRASSVKGTSTSAIHYHVTTAANVWMVSTGSDVIVLRASPDLIVALTSTSVQPTLVEPEPLALTVSLLTPVSAHPAARALDANKVRFKLFFNKKSYH